MFSWTPLSNLLIPLYSLNPTASPPPLLPSTQALPTSSSCHRTINVELRHGDSELHPALRALHIDAQQWHACVPASGLARRLGHRIRVVTRVKLWRPYEMPTLDGDPPLGRGGGNRRRKLHKPPAFGASFAHNTHFTGLLHKTPHFGGNSL
jgi:hypothetical protein